MDNQKAVGFALPAYPIGPDSSLNYPNENGLTKLEAFTMAAMQGLCANTRFLQQTEGLQEREHGATWDCLAMNAVEIAKATLSELSKQRQG